MRLSLKKFDIFKLLWTHFHQVIHFHYFYYAYCFFSPHFRILVFYFLNSMLASHGGRLLLIARRTLWNQCDADLNHMHLQAYNCTSRPTLNRRGCTTTTALTGWRSLFVSLSRSSGCRGRVRLMYSMWGNIYRDTVTWDCACVQDWFSFWLSVGLHQLMRATKWSALFTTYSNDIT